MFMAFMFLLTTHAPPPLERPFLEIQQRAGVVCLAQAEARVAMTRNKLANPLPALRAMARRTQSEPLRSRLCRLDERFVYEMALLRRDGKVVRVFVDAQDARTPVPSPR